MPTLNLCECYIYDISTYLNRSSLSSLRLPKAYPRNYCEFSNTSKASCSEQTKPSNTLRTLLILWVHTRSIGYVFVIFAANTDLCGGKQNTQLLTNNGPLWKLQQRLNRRRQQFRRNRTRCRHILWNRSVGSRFVSWANYFMKTIINDLPYTAFCPWYRQINTILKRNHASRWCFRLRVLPRVCMLNRWLTCWTPSETKPYQSIANQNNKLSST